jgi:hypothetical protein
LSQDARRRGITKDELEKTAGEEMADCMRDAQLAGAETKVGDLFLKDSPQTNVLKTF